MHIIEEAINNPKSISIDTRTIKKGDIFIAIKGKRFDGHDFVEQAFEKGARLAVVSKKPKISARHKTLLINVKDTIGALGDIASVQRRKFNIPVVAITGSNGKTTAKDMISFVLSARFNVLKNETSKNNLIGLPLTLLQLDGRHDLAVLEMGMNHLGEIGKLSRIAKPHIAVITNIGPSHLEFLGTLKNVFMAKTELLKGLSGKDVAILNNDDRFLRNIKQTEYKKVYFGIDKKSHFQAKHLTYKENRWHFALDEGGVFELPIFGKANIYNALISIAVARQFGLDFSTIKERIKAYKQACPMRLEFKNIHGIEILDDSYNSNPMSMECAIDTLSRYDTDGKRIIVTGDMLELGKKTESMHRAIGKTIVSSPADVLITLGRLSRLTNREARRKVKLSCYHAGSHSDAADFLKKIAKRGDVVLVKGSRAMEMDKVIEEFKKGDQGIRGSGDQGIRGSGDQGIRGSGDQGIRGSGGERVMLYHLLYPLKDLWFGFNVFRYITFRSAMASITAFLLSIILGPIIIKGLSHLKIGDSPRRKYVEDLYKLHKHKEGTPTMGGIIIIVSILLSTLMWARLDNRFIILCLISILWLGIVGFIDDYIKLIKAKSLGLSATAKFTGQMILAMGIALYLYFDPNISTQVFIPFLKHAVFNLGLFYILFVVLVIVGTSNAVNLTDGLDGLAIGCISFIALSYSIISYLTGHVKFSGYLNMYYLPGSGELTVFCACLVGAGLGFLWFNSYPATVFMGDTGALPLGGAIGIISVLIKKEILLLIIGGVFVAEAASVIIQVLSFRFLGKRVFLMAPLHHHFQLLGWPESKVTIRFWIIGIILALFGLATLKLM